MVARLAELGVGVEVQVGVHRVEDAPLHRLQAVAHVGQRARGDDADRVVQVAPLRLDRERGVGGRRRIVAAGRRRAAALAAAPTAVGSARGLGLGAAREKIQLSGGHRAKVPWTLKERDPNCKNAAAPRRFFLPVPSSSLALTSRSWRSVCARGAACRRSRLARSTDELRARRRAGARPLVRLLPRRRRAARRPPARQLCRRHARRRHRPGGDRGRPERAASSWPRSSAATARRCRPAASSRRRLVALIRAWIAAGAPR